MQTILKPAMYQMLLLFNAVKLLHISVTPFWRHLVTQLPHNRFPVITVCSKSLPSACFQCRKGI